MQYTVELTTNLTDNHEHKSSYLVETTEDLKKGLAVIAEMLEYAAKAEIVSSVVITIVPRNKGLTATLAYRTNR